MFGRVFICKDAVAVGGRPDVRYYLCLSVVAMGDHNAVDIVQVVHEGAGSGNEMELWFSFAVCIEFAGGACCAPKIFLDHLVEVFASRRSLRSCLHWFAKFWALKIVLFSVVYRSR